MCFHSYKYRRFINSLAGPGLIFLTILFLSLQIFQLERVSSILFCHTDIGWQEIKSRINVLLLNNIFMNNIFENILVIYIWSSPLIASVLSNTRGRLIVFILTGVGLVLATYDLTNVISGANLANYHKIPPSTFYIVPMHLVLSITIPVLITLRVRNTAKTRSSRKSVR